MAPRLLDSRCQRPAGDTTMRRHVLPVAAAIGVLLSCASASAQTHGGQFEGFGGVTIGNTASASTFGGGVAIPIGGYAQIIGEAGRLSDIKSSLLDTALDLTPIDVRMSAWYAEGGIRVMGSSHSAVRPYAEATAGIARLTPGIQNAGQWGAIGNAALAFLSETEPLLGAGAGVMFQGGPLLLDVGYRYKKILADGALASAFALSGDGFEVSHVRIGLGIRF